jgi:hypothetical protein
MGGYAQYSKAGGSLNFYQKQTEFSSLMTKFAIPNANIADIAFEGKDEVNRRTTVMRLLTLGIFAFAFKKKSKNKEAYITLSLSDGQEAIFFVDDKAPMELRTKLASVVSNIKMVK